MGRWGASEMRVSQITELVPHILVPTTSTVHLHVSPTQDQLSTLSTWQGAVE
ncbi:hypothetical protein BDR04DRAFT_1098858 [Suillus decipiens]|nr:hypothetical protein BDR04DRAFT_1098858 [Suillus decipiens]